MPIASIIECLNNSGFSGHADHDLWFNPWHPIVNRPLKSAIIRMSHKLNSSSSKESAMMNNVTGLSWLSSHVSNPFMPNLNAGDNSVDSIGDLVRVGWP